MKESGWYPPGAEFDPNAPYNQVEPEEKEYKVTAMYCIRRTDEIWSSKYDECDNLCDPQREWESVYMTPLELFEECKQLAIEAISHEQPGSVKYERLRNIIDNCFGWEIVESEFDQL